MLDYPAEPVTGCQRLPQRQVGGGFLVSVAQQATPMQAVLIIVAPELCALMHITPIHHPIATVSSFAPTLSLLHGLSGLHEAI